MVYGKIKRFILGEPLASHREHAERLNIPLGLAVFASDVLSSSAYATEEILIALAATSYALAANQIAIPIAMAICLLLIIVVISYRQVIIAYPNNGGAYLVTKENLGQLPSLVAAAALLIDYALTVAVSISAGVAALTSTGWVSQENKVGIAIGFVSILVLINLRGAKESGKMIAFPAYGFMIGMVILISYGVLKWSQGGAPPAPLEVSHVVPDMTLSLALVLVMLNAFSHGCAALTGTEAIADGVNAFQKPEARNANRTMLIMAFILGAIFIGLTYLASLFHVMPVHHETVVSQIARSVFGANSFMYFYIQLSTMVILFLAANTSFAGFPRLSSILADDGFMPRQLMTLGDKLVFSNGIVLLGIIAAGLIWLYHADTHALIPLYAVGVFTTFTLAQAGMVLYQPKYKKPGWRYGLVINAVGAVVTGVVTVILAAEKFREGAWIILLAIPLMIVGFKEIAGHYKSVRKQLALPDSRSCHLAFDNHRVLVLVAGLHRGTLAALDYAKLISPQAEAIHVELNPESTAYLKSVWDDWGCGIPLKVLESPYRSINEPILDYIEDITDTNTVVTVIVPEFVPKRFWHNFMHNQTAIMLRTLLRFKKNVIVTTVRHHLEE